MRARLTLAVGTVALGGLLLTGCGASEEGTADAGSTTAPSAAAPVQDAGTSESTVLADVAKASSAAKTAKATITSSGAGQDVVGEGVFAFGTPASASYNVSVDSDGQKQEIGLILVDGKVYLKLGDLGQQQGGKTWVKVDPKGTDPLSKSFATLADSLTDAGDVASSIKLLQAGATVKDLGSESVDGVAATKYLITTDIAEALKTATGATKTGLQQLKDSSVTKVTATLWVDAQNLPVQYQQVSKAKGVEATTNVRYSDWGKPVSITAPPASQVGTLQDLLGG